MSSISIVNYLLSRDAAVKALVANRVYPISAPQAVDQAYIVTNLVSRIDHPTIGGAGQNYRERIQIEAIAPSGDVALAIMEAVTLCLDEVVDRNVLTFKDVSCLSAGVAMTDTDDRNNEARRALQQYQVWWKRK